MSDATNSLSSLVPLSWLSGDTTLGPSDTHYGPSGAPIQISQYEYDRLRQLEFSQTCYSSTHTSSSVMDAYIVSPHRP